MKYPCRICDKVHTSLIDRQACEKENIETRSWLSR